MFCGKCGTNNPENVKFCSKCGAPLETLETPAVESQSAEKKPANTNKIVGIAAVAAVVVVVLILILSLFGGRGYKSTVKKYIDATYSGNGKAIVNLIPKKVIQDTLEDEGYKKSDTKIIIEELDESLAKQLNRIGDSWSYKYEITDVENSSTRDLRDLQDDYEDYYGIKVKASKTVTVELTVTLDDYDDYEYTTTLTVSVVKIGSSWYIDVVNMRMNLL